MATVAGETVEGVTRGVAAPICLGSVSPSPYKVALRNSPPQPCCTTHAMRSRGILPCRNLRGAEEEMKAGNGVDMQVLGMAEGATRGIATPICLGSIGKR